MNLTHYLIHMPKQYSMSRNEHATHECNSFLNPCAETIVLEPKRARCSALGLSIDHFRFLQFAPKVLIDKHVRIICE